MLLTLLLLALLNLTITLTTTLTSAFPLDNRLAILHGLPDKHSGPSDNRLAILHGIVLPDAPLSHPAARDVFRRGVVEARQEIRGEVKARQEISEVEARQAIAGVEARQESDEGMGGDI